MKSVKSDRESDKKVILISCLHCGAQMRVYPSPAYPVKLPAGCPCCLRHIYSYTVEHPNNAA